MTLVDGKKVSFDINNNVTEFEFNQLFTKTTKENRIKNRKNKKLLYRSERDEVFQDQTTPRKAFNDSNS
jgi:hypothetical protein